MTELLLKLPSKYTLMDTIGKNEISYKQNTNNDIKYFHATLALRYQL